MVKIRKILKEKEEEEKQEVENIWTKSSMCVGGGIGRAFAAGQVVDSLVYRPLLEIGLIHKAERKPKQYICRLKNNQLKDA